MVPQFTESPKAPDSFLSQDPKIRLKQINATLLPTRSLLLVASNAKSVLPVPGEPNNKAPLGILAPIDKYKVIHRSILNYELDKNSIVNDPRGMFGNNLKVNFYKFAIKENFIKSKIFNWLIIQLNKSCLLYTSPSPRDRG